VSRSGAWASNVRFQPSRSWSFNIHDAAAAARARRSLVQALRVGGAADGDFEAAELILGELIGNVARYAPGVIEVTLEWGDRWPTLHVVDRGPGFDSDPRLPGDPYSEAGRGLYIVSVLGMDLRAEQVPGRGNHVSVTLPVPKRCGSRATV
jgi:signal transduction histidine kinase